MGWRAGLEGRVRTGRGRLRPESEQGSWRGEGPWLTAVFPQNTLIQELESSQRQIEEQHHHKVPSCGASPPSLEGPRRWEERTWLFFIQLL